MMGKLLTIEHRIRKAFIHAQDMTVFARLRSALPPPRDYLFRPSDPPLDETCPLPSGRA